MLHARLSDAVVLPEVVIVVSEDYGCGSARSTKLEFVILTGCRCHALGGGRRAGGQPKRRKIIQIISGLVVVARRHRTKEKMCARAAPPLSVGCHSAGWNTLPRTNLRQLYRYMTLMISLM